MNISYDSDADLWRAYTKSKIDLWDQNFINDKYIIAYEFNPGLDPKVQDMLPKVNISGPEVPAEIPGDLFPDNSELIKAMEKIEAATCIKFEDKSKNNHKEWFCRLHCLNHAAY